MNVPVLANLDTLKPPLRTPRWVWRLPWIAAALLPVVIGVLLWLLYDNEREEQRLALISDVLWIEQALRFQMDRNAEQLGILGADLFEHDADARTRRLRAQSLIEQSDSLVQIAWLDPQGRVLEAVPPSLPRAAPFAAARAQHEALRSAARLGRPLYSPPYAIEGNDARFDVYVPHYRAGTLAGVTVGVYSTYTLITQTVPWWFTERYRLSLIDDAGTVLAANSAVPAERNAPSYQLAFEPLGATLRIAAHGASTRLVPGVLMGTIVLLAAAILLSLRAVRRHVQRRLSAEQALQEEHAFRKAMEDSLLTGLRARDLTGRIIYVNPAFCRMVGWSAEELIGRGPPMPYWAPETVEQTVAVHDRILAGSGPHEAVEVRFRRKNGERFDALIYEAPLIDAHGRHTGWMGSVLDITARKRAEELYRQQQEKFQFTARLVTLGEMASMLAHELNQPLSAISSYTTGTLNVLEQSPATRPEVIETLRKVVAQAQRAGQVIRRVHEFARRREPRLEPCVLPPIIEDTIGLIESIARSRAVRLRIDVAPDLPPACVDRVMIEQVLLNLIRNGIDAMAHTPEEARLLAVAAAAWDQGVRLSVADRGGGIAPDVAARMYEPFFSTKEDGMGVGLSICRSITELHRGRLWFEARADGGTVFHLWLPAAA
ncbi:MAG TPA: PAS domain S-box protein [Burkholderiales bacterium]